MKDCDGGHPPRMVGEGPFNTCSDASMLEDTAQGVVPHGLTDIPRRVSWLRVVVDVKEKGRVNSNCQIATNCHP